MAMMTVDNAGLKKCSSEGYTISNVVPCCKQCNIAKSDFFTYQEMLKLGLMIQEIKDSRKSKK